MSINSEFEAGAREYAARLDEEKDREKQAARAAATRHDDNAAAFAAAITDALNKENS